MKTKMRKGMGIGDIAPIGIAVTVGIIVIAVGAYILGTMNSNISDTNTTYVIGKGVTAIKLFADWFSIIVIVAVSVIVIGLIYFLQRRGGGNA